MNSYQVEITGTSPLLLHNDNITFADGLKKWREVPANKALSVPGDDRSPAFSWLACLYEDGLNIVMPADNLMRCLMEGGASVPTGKGPKTFKAQTQSGMLVREAAWPLTIDGRALPFAPFDALKTELEFSVHEQAAKDHGFVLFVKRAKIGSAKHVRVRPKFYRWSCGGVIDVQDQQLTLSVLQTILTFSGRYKGLGDWRPSGRTPGPFGMFSATVTKI